MNVAARQVGSPAFEAAGLAYAVAGKQLLGPLDLALAAGSVSGLVGHNGSGKSTLLKLLARQIEPTSGTASFGGRPLPDWSPRAFARAVAYLPQSTPAALGLTVRELVSFGRYPWHGPLGRFGPADHRKVDEAIEQTGIGDFATRLVDTLSGGERQRAWIAMLLAQDSRCLLLDEPTSALDVAHQIEVLSLIRRLARERSLTVVIVLHDINMAARICERIEALKHGQRVAAGTPEEIMTPDRLHDIYGIDMSVMPHPRTGAPLACVD